MCDKEGNSIDPVEDYNYGEVMAERAGLLGDLKEAVANLKKPMYREDGKLNL